LFIDVTVYENHPFDKIYVNVNVEDKKEEK